MHFPGVLDRILIVFLTLGFAANISAHAVYNRREQLRVSPLSKASTASVSTIFPSSNSTPISSHSGSTYSNRTSLRNSTTAIALAPIPSTSLSTVTPASHVVPSHPTRGWSSRKVPSTSNRSGFPTNVHPQSSFGSEHQVEGTSVEGSERTVSDKSTTPSTSQSRSLILPPESTITTRNSSLSTSFTTPQKLLYTQVDASNHTSIFTIPITTTITSPPAGFSITNASNSQWTSDTTTTLNGSVVPVLLTGVHKGLLLNGLGVGAAVAGATNPTNTDSSRPGCDFSGLLVLLNLVIPCGAEFLIPGLVGKVVFSPKGFPIYEPPAAEPPAYIDDAPPAYSDDETSYSKKWPVYDPPESNPNDDHDDDDEDDDDENSSGSKPRTTFEERKSSMSKSREDSMTASLNHSATRSFASTSTNGTTSSAPSSASASTNGTVSSTFSATRSSASSSPSGTVADWFIQVRPTADIAEVQSIKNAIVSAAGGTENVAEISFDGNPGSTAFVASLTNTSADILNKTQPIEVDLDIELTEEDDDIVGESKPTSTSATSSPKATSPINSRERRASGTSDNPRPVIQKRVPLVTQYPASPHLKFISQHYAIEDLSFFEDYVWQAPGGEGIDLFVVDTGANPNNRDYIDMHHQPIWLWPQENDQEFWNKHLLDPYWYETSDSSGLGSCTLSLAAGYYFGSSKWTQTYILKIPGPNRRTRLALSTWVASASTVYNQMRRARDEQQNGPSVVLFPRTFDVWGDDLSTRSQEVIRNILGLLFQMDASIITSIGIPKILPDGSLKVQWPAAAKKWFSQLVRVGPVQVTGYVGQIFDTPNSRLAPPSRAQLSTVVDVWAPGSPLTCASGEGFQNRILSGSEYSAAIVAGFAASLLSTFLPELTLTMGRLQQTLAQTLLDFMTRDAVVVAADGTETFRPGSFSRGGGPKAISNGLSGSCFIPNPVLPWKRNAENTSEAEPLACRLQSSTVSSAPTTLISDTPPLGHTQTGTATVLAGIQGEKSAAAALASISSASVLAASSAHAGIAAVIAGIQGGESAVAATAAVSSSSIVAASLARAEKGAPGSATVAVVEQIASTLSTGAGAARTTPHATSASTPSAILSPSPSPTWAVFIVYQIYTWTGVDPLTDYYNKIYLKNVSINTAEPDFCAADSWVWNRQLEDEVEGVPPYPTGALSFPLPAGIVEKIEDDCTWKADSGPGDLKCNSFLKSVTCMDTTTPALICPGDNPNRIVPLAKCVW